MIKSKSILLHHNFIRIISCIIGYSIWAFMAQNQQIKATQTIPIYFYNLQQDFIINAAEKIEVTVSGTRTNMYHFDNANNAIHLDASQFRQGSNEIALSQENLFLPDNINLINLKPSYITINITKKHE